jgi:hypothetical protein
VVELPASGVVELGAWVVYVAMERMVRAERRARRAGVANDVNARMEDMSKG